MQNAPVLFIVRWGCFPFLHHDYNIKYVYNIRKIVCAVRTQSLITLSLYFNLSVCRTLARRATNRSFERIYTNAVTAFGKSAIF